MPRGKKCFSLLGGILLVTLVSLAQAGEGFLLEPELRWPTGVLPEQLLVVPGQEGPLVWVIGGGRGGLFRWAPPFFIAYGFLAPGNNRIYPWPVNANGRFVLSLSEDGLGYQLWQEEDKRWRPVFSGVFTTRVMALAAGYFTGEGQVGLFVQFETGKIGYYQFFVEEGLLPIWQSPAAWPLVEQVRVADLDGDRREEALLIHSDGSLTIARWQAGLWEAVWRLPSWGRVLAVDLGQADDTPGLEVVLTTAQRQVFLLAASVEGGLVVKARLALPGILPYVALVPRGGGAVLLGDAAGSLELWVPQGSSWRLEARFSTGERLVALAGLAEGRVLALDPEGRLRSIALIPLDRLVIYFDGTEVGRGGIYWDDGQFYFGLEFIRRVLGILPRWDEKKATLSLSQSGLVVTVSTAPSDKPEAVINGRVWPLKRRPVVSGKNVYVPAELLQSVFLINVTYDPTSQWLILTGPSLER